MLLGRKSSRDRLRVNVREITRCDSVNDKFAAIVSQLTENFPACLI